MFGHRSSIPPATRFLDAIRAWKISVPAVPRQTARSALVHHAIAGGWTINGVTYLSDGVPIVAPVVGAQTSYFNQRTNMVCDPSRAAPHTAAVWFNPNCFTTPASPFVAGTAPAYLDNVRTMGAEDLDLSLFKSFTMGKERSLRLEVSSYNVTNKAQFSAPNVSSSSSGYVQFGQILSTSNTPRQFQFGSKFTF